jgi:hypothetical protein
MSNDKPCACRVVKKGDEYTISRCHLHTASQDLLDALKHGHTDDDGVICAGSTKYPCRACKAISNAEPWALR